MADRKIEAQEAREQLRKLAENLNDEQAIYSAVLISRLFGFYNPDKHEFEKGVK